MATGKIGKLEDQWDQIKNRIKYKWRKFSDKEVNAFKKDMNGIVNKLQKTYGYAKHAALDDYNEFKVDLKNYLKAHPIHSAKSRDMVARSNGVRSRVTTNTGARVHKARAVTGNHRAMTR